MKDFKKIKKKQLLSTLVALACVGHGYASDPATTTTTENGVTNNNWNIVINNIKEDSGLELGTNARARGNGSIATGNGSLAVGNNAVATGGNETKDTITSKLNENRQKLHEIDVAQNTVTSLVNEIQKIRSEQAKIIEAGERIKQVRLAKEKAHQDYLNKQNAWSTEVANSAEFLRNAQSKLDDLNNRLGAVNRLGGVDINSEAGLTAAAINLKRMTEEGSTLNLPLDTFYKGYIKAHYKAIGDLRLKQIESEKYGRTSVENNKLVYNYQFYASNSYDYLNRPVNGIITNTLRDLMHKDMERFDNVGVYYYSIGSDNTGIRDNKIVDRDHSPTLKQLMASNSIDTIDYLPDIDPVKDTINQNVYDKINTFWNEYWNKVDSIFNAYKNPIIRDEDKILFKNHAYRNLAQYKSMLDSVYYQFKYEETHDTSWLDKKERVRQSELYKKYFYETNNNPLDRMLNERFKEINDARKQWLDTNINDVKEANKITTNKLTADLEIALKIKRNEVAEKEKQIATLKASADQAKKNWESINPNASDLLYMEQYEALMRQLTTKAQELQQNQERLTALKNALTLHDLTNVGENAMAVGTNALSTGSNSIAIGTGSIVIGENSISIGKNSAVTGTNSIAIGVGHIVIGNNAGTFGDPNTIYGDGSYAFGNNNTIGDATTTHTVGTNTFVLGSNVTTKVNNSVILGKDSVANEDNVVSIGSTTSTRKLVNVTDGTIAENSKEAINGNQLWKVSEAKDGSINKTAWQAALGTGKNAAGNTGLITGDTLHAALSTVQIDPATLNTKANKDASNISTEDASKWSEKLGTGTVTDGNTGLVTGGTVNTAITNAVKDATSSINNGLDSKFNAKANKDASNISTEDASKWSEKLGTGTVTDGNTGLVTGGTVNTAITNAVKDATSSINNGLDSKFNAKANKDASNISTEDASKWSEKLGTGTVTDGNTGLVTGGTVNTAITNAVKDATSSINNGLDSKFNAKANKDASNISTEDASKWSEKLGTGTVTDGNTGLVTGGTVNTAITNAVKDATSSINNGLDSKFNAKANKDASNISTEDASKWSEKLGTGTVGQGESSNGLVTGKSVYEAIHKYTPKGLVQTDGKTITVDKSGAANHIDFSGTDKNGNSILREITGVMTNPNDPNSVVNVDTLQSQTQGLNQKLTKAVNVGTATASALAALHPLDFDEANKVSFAVSHGQYNGSKATAFGGFVRPNQDFMISLASTISSTDRAWNAGVSFKIGSGSSHKKISQNDFEALRNKNDKLENELNQLKEELSKLSTRLSPKRTSFPDVPKDHWANEAIESLHGNDVLDGYPDGEFKGDKQLTRYEYAQMLYKGLK